jgi:hypothetical protein
MKGAGKGNAEGKVGDIGKKKINSPLKFYWLLQ